MSSTPEGRITAAIIRWLNDKPMTTAHKVAAGPYQQRGEPDVDAVSSGRAIKLEVKRPGTEAAIVKSVTPTQAARLLEYAAAGALVGVVTSPAEVEALLDCPVSAHTLAATVRARMAALGRRQREASVGSSA